MELRIIKSECPTCTNGSSLYVEFDLDGKVGTFSQNIYDDTGEVVYCVEVADADIYATWSTTISTTKAIHIADGFREVFEECFSIRIPEE